MRTRKETRDMLLCYSCLLAMLLLIVFGDRILAFVVGGVGGAE